MKLRNDQIKCLKAMKEIDSILIKNNIWYCLSYGSALGAFREGGFIEWDGDIDLLIKIPDQKKVGHLIKEGLSDEFKVISYENDSISGYDEVDIIGISADDMHIDIYPVVGAPDEKNKAFLFMKRCRRVHRILECKYLEFDRLKKKWKIPFVFLIRLIEYLIPDRILREYFEKLKNKYAFSEAKLFFPIGNDGHEKEIMESSLLFNTKRIPFEDTMFPVPFETERYLECLYGCDYMTPKRY